MQELALIPLVTGAAAKLSQSALPHSPVVPDMPPTRPPGRLRVLAATTLHHMANRLDGGLAQPPRRPATR